MDNPHFSSYDQYLSHWLFRAIRKAAMRKSGGKCVKCGAVATQVHHWRRKNPRKKTGKPEFEYPRPWGAFDVPDNIWPICYACHCEEHGETK